MIKHYSGLSWAKAVITLLKIIDVNQYDDEEDFEVKSHGALGFPSPQGVQQSTAVCNSLRSVCHCRQISLLNRGFFGLTS